MVTTDDKLEQQNAQTQELTDEELNLTTGGDLTPGANYISINGIDMYHAQGFDINGLENTPPEFGVTMT